jgi:hypothetical protein
MKEAIVRRLFPQLADQLGDFSPEWLAVHASTARKCALRTFNHQRKIDSILYIAEAAHILGSDGLHECMQDRRSFLLCLPYIGPVTWRHLAKNLGLPVAKADRHLTRFTEAAGRLSVDALCKEISDWIGDPIAVVDTVLWRWSTLHAQPSRVPRTRTCR